MLYLGLTIAEIEDLQRQSNFDLSRMHTLLTWRKGTVTTNQSHYRALLKVLVDCESMKSAHKLCQILSQQNETET